MRYAYIKNGDAIEQVDALLAMAEYPKGGPNAFIGDLLRLVGDDPVLILSCAGRASKYSKGSLVAQVYNWRPGPLGWIFAPFKRFISTLSGAVKIVEFHPDVIICGRTGGFLWASYIAAVYLRVPFIHSRHNRVCWSKGSLLKRLSEYIDVIIIKRAQAVLVHGPYLKQQALNVKVDRERIFEFDQGITEFMSDNNDPKNSKEKSDENILTILFVGRMEREKGIFDLLEAVRELLDSGIRIRLFYVGRGAHSEELRQKVIESKLSDVVDIKGVVDHAQLPQLMKTSSVIVTPTRSSFPEGRCMVVMEAFAVGVPVIAPDTGPFPYLIETEVNGLLYKADSMPSLRDAIRSLLVDKELLRSLASGAKKTGQKLVDENISFGESLSRALTFINGKSS